MYPCTQDVLNQILYLIERDKCSQAVKVWSDYRRKETPSCRQCHYEDFGMKEGECSMCLESKLRTLSLYEHEPESFGHVLQNAARKLQDYRQQLH